MLTQRHYVFIRNLVVFLCCAGFVISQDIGYPEQDVDDVNRQNANNRTPIFIPKLCKDNEWLYPGDHDTDWICDCAPGYIYHSPTQKCHLIYHQGPCNTGEYLFLSNGSIIPECVSNPCQINGYVQFNNSCHQFGTSGPCSNPELSNVVGINTTTLEITCVRLSRVIGTRFDEPEENPPKTGEVISCPLGCRRHLNGSCWIEVN